MPLIETRGAASAQGFGEFAQSAAVNYIEDVFSTYLYTGTGSSQTITNGIDLSGKGGMVFQKARSAGLGYSFVYDTARGAAYFIETNSIGAQGNSSLTQLSSFNSNGFSLGYSSGNDSGYDFVSWTFRKQAKFFDVVTYTGNGSSQTINHNLGSTPGCIIVKSTSSTGDWYVYHRTLGPGLNGRLALKLNTTAAASDSGGFADHPTSTVFTVNYAANTSSVTYVAYLFAHDAGGFGLSGSDNVISCGSFATGGGGTGSVDLGYEPQWVLLKQSNAAGEDWYLVDVMRGMNNTTNLGLSPNTSGGEQNIGAFIKPKATGFEWSAGDSRTYIYIAIRRGPMKVPTSGTSVYNAIARNGTGAVANVTGVGFAPDLSLSSERGTVFVGDKLFFDKLRGANARLTSTATSAESSSATDMLTAFGMDGVTLGADANWYINKNANPYINWYFRRSPGFFDVVCYAGTGSNLTVSHNLTVAPQLIIIKNRTNAWSWNVGYNFGVSSYDFLTLDNNDPGTNNSYNSHYTAAPTTTQFFLATNVRVNQNNANFVAYLFATLAGVSKVGTYTGTGTTKQIDCGFTGGARFVLIKRTDNIGDWYVWDTARGIVASTDPYLLLNSTAAEVTNTDYVDTYSAGFELSSTAPAALNANGGSFIFFAVA